MRRKSSGSWPTRIGCPWNVRRLPADDGGGGGGVCWAIVALAVDVVALDRRSFGTVLMILLLLPEKNRDLDNNQQSLKCVHMSSQDKLPLGTECEQEREREIEKKAGSIAVELLVVMIQRR